MGLVIFVICRVVFVGKVVEREFIIVVLNLFYLWGSKVGERRRFIILEFSFDLGF